MKGDFTRFTYDRSKHYHGVVMQQGRVTLDADWNENLGIATHQLQTLARDVIGECGVPVHVDAFKIEAPAINLGKQPLDFKIGAGPKGKGRMYVSGLLAEIEQDTTFLTQPDWPSAPPSTSLDGLGPALPALADGQTRVDQVYIDIWRRAISAVEDPHLREVALGGADTAERVKLVWQVKVNPGVDPKSTCGSLVGAPGLGGGKLQVVVNPQSVPPDPCEPTAQGGYTGPDNRFYRIEIHDGGPLKKATFKWSRDNGSVLASIEQFKSDTEVVVRSLGKDDYLKFKTGDWVEVTDDAVDLSDLPGTLAQITVDEASRTLTLSHPLPSAVWTASDRHAKVRRWDGGDAQVITTGTLDIEAGIQVKFTATADDFRTGDYWTFAARVIDGSLDPTLDQPTPPMGIHHATCNLAIIAWTRAGNNVTAVVHDCRLLFPPLTELPRGGGCCCTVSVGDGVHSQGDFSDIQTAINSLKNGGKVCILPGDYSLSAPVVVEGITDLTIGGCGYRTRIHAASGEHAFLVDGANRFRLEGVYIDGQATNGLVYMMASRSLELYDCELINLGSQQETPVEPPKRLKRIQKKPIAEAVVEKAASPVLINLLSGKWSFNEIAYNLDPAALKQLQPVGPALVVANSQLVQVIHNQIIGLPALSLQAQFLLVRDNDLSVGGIWLRDGSGQAVLTRNSILSGSGSGILLGGLGVDEKPSTQYSGIQNVQITGNEIGQMDSGITTLAMTQDQMKQVGDISEVLIADNRITECAPRGRKEPLTETMAAGGIVVRSISQLRIHHNTITNNGLPVGPAACGIFTYLCEDQEINENMVADNGESASAASQIQCIDFSTMAVGQGSNPRKETGATFRILNDNGNPMPYSQVVKRGGITGLNPLMNTTIELDQPATQVQITVFLSNKGGRLEALNEDMTSAGTYYLQASLDPQTFSFTGSTIRSILVFSEGNESLLLQKVCFDGMETDFQAGITVLDAMGGQNTVVVGGFTEYHPFRETTSRPAVHIHDNEVICPRGQALIAAGLGAMSINDNLLVSNGFRNQPDLSSLVGTTADNINPLLAACGGVLILDSGRTLEIGAASFGTVNMASHYENTVIAQTPTTRPVYPEGRIQFHDNQVTLKDAGVSTQPLFRIAVMIGSLDDVSLEGNQIRIETADEILAIGTLAVGFDVRSADNRFTEIPGHSLVSYFGIGGSAITVNNLATQCILTNATNKIDSPNLSLNCP